MSVFDENPFREPTIDNPFADLAVQQIVNNSTQIQVEDYNPFKKPLQYNPTDDEPATIQPTPVPTKPFLNTAELLRRQEELERKEEELARKEEEMRRSTYNGRRNNWPPFPAQCCFQPCFYQDIQIDIPLEFQNIVLKLYYLWLLHATVMFLNVICGIIMLEIKIIGLGILLAIMFTPFSYMCWFRPAYKAFRSDSSFNFMVFFIIFFFQFVVTSIQAIGIPGSGTVGIILAIEQFDGTPTGTLLGIFALLIATGFGCAASADLYLIIKIRRIYRSTGASFAKAQTEFTAEFFKSPHVVGAAASAVSAVVQSQFSQNVN